MEGPAPREVEVTDSGRVLLARELARRFALAVGFPDLESEEIALAVGELATNLVKHARGGFIRLQRAQEESRCGLRIESEDHGPGIFDVERALADGFSTAGGLGLGLGTVNRLMDGIEFGAAPGGGTRVVCRRWIRPQVPGMLPRMLEFGVASRPKYGMRDNGDAFIMKCWPRHALVGLIDGLGHGEHALRAAQSARLYLEAHYDAPLDSLFSGADRACRATRGVVMNLARFDLDAHRFDFAGVGNVEVRLFADGAECRDFVVRRGIVGMNTCRAHVSGHAWAPDSVLLMHSDGLRSHWNWNDFPTVMWRSPNELALTMLRTLGKSDDDATVLVVRSAAHDL